MALGAPLVDPYTKESLGQAEREIGVVEVQRVDPKVSYARLLSGNLPARGTEIVLRPVGDGTPAVADEPVAPAPARPIVKLPGDS
jgi:hypothetical protein